MTSTNFDYTVHIELTTLLVILQAIAVHPLTCFLAGDCLYLFWSLRVQERDTHVPAEKNVKKRDKWEIGKIKLQSLRV